MNDSGEKDTIKKRNFWLPLEKLIVYSYDYWNPHCKHSGECEKTVDARINIVSTDTFSIDKICDLTKKIKINPTAKTNFMVPKRNIQMRK